MKKKSPCLFISSILFFAAAVDFGSAQTPESAAPGFDPSFRPSDSVRSAPAVSPSPPVSFRLREGIRLYSEGKWQEAAAELRRAQAEASSLEQQAEAMYWIGLAELAGGGYEAAVKDMDDLIRVYPASPRRAELSYHKGRAYYFLGRYDEAIVLLKDYADQTGEGEESRKSAALYWIGECLFALGQLDKARDIFALIMEQYPRSAKFEAASYRLELINQKKIELELLGLLKWSHEESLRTMEEYQRRERSYDQALIAYQKRIADMLKDTRLADLETANSQYRQQLVEAEARIQSLESLQNGYSLPAAGENGRAENQAQDRDAKIRAQRLKDEIERNIKILESNGNGGALQ
jgi:TolA-binding protein